MDSDDWSSRLAVAKHKFALHHSLNPLSDRFCIDDFDGEDEGRTDLLCPYCYEDHDIASLSMHLEDEHSFESRVAMCPICTLKVPQDMLSHITVQHAQLFKLQRRHRLGRVAIPNSQGLSMLGRDLREAHLQVLLGGNGYRSSNIAPSNAVNNSFLSSLIVNFPSNEADKISKSILSSSEDFSDGTMVKRWNVSFDPSLSFEEREKKIREATGRAGFVQNLLLSTILDD